MYTYKVCYFYINHGLFTYVTNKPDFNTLSFQSNVFDARPPRSPTGKRKRCKPEY